MFIDRSPGNNALQRSAMSRDSLWQVASDGEAKSHGTPPECGSSQGPGAINISLLRSEDMSVWKPRPIGHYSTLEIPSGLIMMNEHSPLAPLQNNVPRRTIFVFVASGNVKLKFAVFNPALIGSSFSSP